MDVTGISVEKAQEIENGSIVSGHVNESGHLVLVNGAGTEINAGLVRDTLANWPVGSIFVNTTATNPNTLLGGGTWERFGQGRVLVSQNDADAEFNVSEEVGGEKTHTLTAGELAEHVHFRNVYKSEGVLGGSANNLGVQGSNVASDWVMTPDSEEVNDGAGGAHNNLQPYIVVYMWKRTV